MDHSKFVVLIEKTAHRTGEYIAILDALYRITCGTIIRQRLLSLYARYRSVFYVFWYLLSLKRNGYTYLHAHYPFHSLFMVSIADASKYWQLMLSQGVGMGIGQGLILVPLYAIQGHRSRSDRL